MYLGTSQSYAMASDAVSVAFWRGGRPFTPQIYVRDLVAYRQAVAGLQSGSPGLGQAKAKFVADVLDRQHASPASLLDAVASSAMDQAFHDLWATGMRVAYARGVDPATFHHAKAWPLVRHAFAYEADAVAAFARIRRAVVANARGLAVLAVRINRIHRFDPRVAQLIAATETRAWTHRHDAAEAEAQGQLTYRIVAELLAAGRTPCRRCLRCAGEACSVYDFFGGPPFHLACVCAGDFHEAEPALLRGHQPPDPLAYVPRE